MIKLVDPRGNEGRVSALSSSGLAVTLTYDRPGVNTLNYSSLDFVLEHLVYPGTSRHPTHQELLDNFRTEDIFNPGETTVANADDGKRDPQDPWPLMFADAFVELWKESDAIGLTKPSTPIGDVVMIIRNLAFCSGNVEESLKSDPWKHGSNLKVAEFVFGLTTLKHPQSSDRSMEIDNCNEALRKLDIDAVLISISTQPDGTQVPVWRAIWT
jgi:hypothetical protein